MGTTIAQQTSTTGIQCKCLGVAFEVLIAQGPCAAIAVGCRAMTDYQNQQKMKLQRLGQARTRTAKL